MERQQRGTVTLRQANQSISSQKEDRHLQASLFFCSFLNNSNQLISCHGLAVPFVLWGNMSVEDAYYFYLSSIPYPFFYWLDTFNATIFNFTDFFFSHMFRFYWVSLMEFYFIYCISQLQNFYLVLLIFFFSISQASRKFPSKD